LSNPALLIAGWAQEKESLAPLAQALHEVKNPILISTSLLAGEKQTYAQNLAEMIHSLSEPPVIIGWSMGGMIAIETLGGNDIPVRALVLISSTARFCDAADYACGIPARSVKAMQLGLEKAPERTLMAFFRALHAPNPTENKELTEQVKKTIASGINPLKQGLNYLIKADLRDNLEKIRIPTLVMHGEKDGIIPFGASEYLANSLPQGRLWMNSEMGHDLPVREAASVSKIISAFIEEQS